MKLFTKKRKIVVYSHDTFGLGNIRRMLVIAQSLVEEDPYTSVLIISGSPMLHAFRIPPQIDYIKLPCLSRTLQGGYIAKFLDIEYEQIIRIRRNIICSSILDFEPDLILVDKKPFGVGDELSSALNELQQQGHRAKAVLLLRDILDSPENTINVWKKNAYHQAIQSFYDRVLVVGSQNIFDLSKEYQFPETSQSKVHYCGYIARKHILSSTLEIRKVYGMANERLVLVTSGGGEDGFQLLKCYLQGLSLQAMDMNVKTLMICGPEMPENQCNKLKGMAEKCGNIIIQNFTDDMLACMQSADLVVCMGGYNTVCELLTLNKRAIVVPRINPVQEQWIRADRMARQGLLQVIHPHHLKPSVLMQRVVKELSRPEAQNIALPQVNLDGLSGVCAAIRNLLEEGEILPSGFINREKLNKANKFKQPYKTSQINL